MAYLESSTLKKKISLSCLHPVYAQELHVLVRLYQNERSIHLLK